MQGAVEAQPEDDRRAHSAQKGASLALLTPNSTRAMQTHVIRVACDYETFSEQIWCFISVYIHGIIIAELTYACTVWYSDP